MKITYSLSFLGLMTLATGLVACGGGGSSSSTGGGGAASTGDTTTVGTGTGTGGAGGAATTATATSTGTSTATATSTGTGTPAPGYCTKPCGTVVDCCPAGAMDCPSNMYPNNYSCDKSACKSPQCATKADCTAIDPNQDCLMLAGFNACSNTCANDGECNAPATCSGVDDNGKKYCLSSGGGCADDAACGGFGKCVNKVCVCQKDADCTKPGFTKCAL